MINISEYIKINKDKHRFKLPISFFEKIKYDFIISIFSFIPFKDRLFVSVDNDCMNLYFEVIFSYLKKNGIELRVWNNSFYGYFKNFVCTVSLYNKNKKESLIIGQSSGVDKHSIISKALGEFLERYTSSKLLNGNSKKVNFKNKEQISKEVHLLNDFHWYDKNQLQSFPEFNILGSDIFRTLPVEELISKKQNLDYPVQQIFWKENKNLKEEKTFFRVTTSGCAGGFTLEEATVGAIYELVERDSFLCFWLTSSTPRKIHIQDGLIKRYDDLKTMLSQVGFEVHLLNTTTDMQVPSCVCAVLGSDSVGLYVSSSTKKNMSEAIEGAVSEMYSCLFEIDERKKEDVDFSSEVYLNKKMSKTERMNGWASKKITRELDFFLSGESEFYTSETFEKEMLSFSSKQEELKWLIGKFECKGDDYNKIYRYKFENNILDELGYCSVRVIIPKLYPMYLNEYSCLRESIRLKEFNLWKNEKKDFLFNVIPHPFP